MMMLLDWSGSMADCLFDTVKQLINLVEFCRKVNIPYEVYFFTSERKYRDGNYSITSWSKNAGEFMFEDFNMVNCVSHRMNKKVTDLALKTLYHMGMYFDTRYTRRYVESEDYYAQSESWGIPSEYYLGNTPLNESLVYINTLLPMFKKKYDIEKMTFITLTDGAGNYPRCDIRTADGGKEEKDWDKTTVYQIDNKKFAERGNITSQLLKHIKKQHDVNIIGFYIIKRVRRWDLERHVGEYKDYYDKDKKVNNMRKELTKHKAVACDNEGYDKYFILDGKKMAVENFDMSKETVKKGSASELKRIFGKSMANRLVSRVVLNKFIQEVA